MKLRYNVTGAPRKALVGAISHELDSPIEYLGAPTFAYKVGGYHIDKTGMVTGEDNLDLEDALRRLGFDTEEREYDEPDTYESGLGELSAWEYPEGREWYPPRKIGLPLNWLLMFRSTASPPRASPTSRRWSPPRKPYSKQLSERRICPFR